jgi:hypothetical protein
VPVVLDFLAFGGVAGAEELLQIDHIGQLPLGQAQ